MYMYYLSTNLLHYNTPANEVCKRVYRSHFVRHWSLVCRWYKFIGSYSTFVFQNFDLVAIPVTMPCRGICYILWQMPSLISGLCKWFRAQPTVCVPTASRFPVHHTYWQAHIPGQQVGWEPKDYCAIQSEGRDFIKQWWGNFYIY